MKSRHASTDRTAATIKLLAGASALTAALLVTTVMLAVSPREAAAKAEFAAQTGKPCGQCHMNPAGSGKLKPFGEKFKANGNKIK